jgi:putative nucleotidyltransferase with HDIG domain
MYLLVPLIEVVFSLALLTTLIISGKPHVARRPFAIFLFLMAAWGFLVFMMRAGNDLSVSLIWEKCALGSILGASMFFYQFTIKFTNTRQNTYFEYPMYVAIVVVLALIPTGLVVSGVRTIWYGRSLVIGPLFPLYLVCFYLPILHSAALLFKQSKISRSVDSRVRYQYIMVGITVMVITATTDYLPALGINMYPLGVFGNILFCVAATMAMLKHNLLEMKVVLRKGATYSLTCALIFGLFGSVIYLLSFFFGDFFNAISLAITALTVFLIALIFHPALIRFQQIVDGWFFRERYKHIQTLKNYTEEIKGELNLEQLTLSLLESVANSMQSRGVYLLLPSPTTGKYAIRNYYGQTIQGQMYFAADNPFLAAVKQQDRVIDIYDLEIIPSLVNLSHRDYQPLVSNNIELIVPLLNDGFLAGVLLLKPKNTCKPYSIEERRLLLTVCRDAALSIDNANRYEDIKQKHGKLQKALDGVIYAISLVVESRDPYTACHQRRVAELAKAIANIMGLSEWRVTGVYIAGLLHDIGKMAVPSEILSKPGKITRDEFSIIKNHPQVGYEILQKIDFPWPVTQAILQHHERLDGSGYPAALRGEEIIIEAKILGVADVVEAMSSHRPYRPSLGLQNALSEISEKAGILYDEAVVKACLDLLNHNEPEFERIMAAAAGESADLEPVIF